MSRPPVTKNSIRFAVNAKMWYSGNAVSITSSPTRSQGRHERLQSWRVIHREPRTGSRVSARLWRRDAT